MNYSMSVRGYGAQDVVRDVSFAAPNGQLTALIGPNGSGKTTLLRAMTRTLPCRSGNILLDGRSIASYGRKEFARTAAFMPQSRPVPGITVRALVAHGRFPYLGFSRRMTAQDTAAVEQAMRRTGTLDWANRDVRALSGGERQRVYLAMALAQAEPPSCWMSPVPFWMYEPSLSCWICCAAWQRAAKRGAGYARAAPGHAVCGLHCPVGRWPPAWLRYLRCPCCHRCGGSGVWRPFVPCAGWGVVCEGGGVSKFWFGRVLKNVNHP